MTQVYCKLCKGYITKYLMDAGANEYQIKGGEVYICDDCAKAIAHQIIDEH